VDPAGESRSEALTLNFDRRLLLQFRGSVITSDGGLLAYRELDDVLGLTRTGGERLAETRTGRNRRHLLVGLLRQSVFGRLVGYEDVNDAKPLCHDPEDRQPRPLRPVPDGRGRGAETDVPGNPVADRAAAGTARADMTRRSEQMCRTTTAEVRPDAGRATRLSASVRSTDDFDHLPRTRHTICRCSRRKKRRSSSHNDRNPENVG
jgi:hypothetical protein